MNEERIRLIQQIVPNHLPGVAAPSITADLFNNMDFMLTSYKTWSTLVQKQIKALPDAPANFDCEE